MSWNPQDTWQQHAADTIKESYLLAHPDTVRVVTENAARGIEDLERWGMPFAREADGPDLAGRGAVAGVRWRRICGWHAGAWLATADDRMGGPGGQG